MTKYLKIVSVNHQLNIIEEIKTLQQKMPDISLEEKLKWATANGSRALGFSDQLGSFEKGKKPGLVQIENVISPHQLPEQPRIKRIL